MPRGPGICAGAVSAGSSVGGVFLPREVTSDDEKVAFFRQKHEIKGMRIMRIKVRIMLKKIVGDCVQPKNFHKILK